MSDNRNNPYTVAQLIAELDKFPKNMCVVISGYEGGYQDAEKPRLREIERNVNDEYYYGPHEDKTGGEKVVYI